MGACPIGSSRTKVSGAKERAEFAVTRNQRRLRETRAFKETRKLTKWKQSHGIVFASVFQRFDTDDGRQSFTGIPYCRDMIGSGRLREWCEAADIHAAQWIAQQANPATRVKPQHLAPTERMRRWGEFGEIVVADDSSDFPLQGINFHETDVFTKIVVRSPADKLATGQQAYKAGPIQLASSSSSSVGRTAQVCVHEDYNDDIFDQEALVSASAHASGWRQYPHVQQWQDPQPESFDL